MKTFKLLQSMTKFERVLLSFSAFSAIFGVALVGCQPAAQQPGTTLVLVRHAEKANDGTQDPPLDSLGAIRADALAHTLQDIDFAAVYSTAYKRTRETVNQIATTSSLELSVYDPNDKAFLGRAVAENAGKALLVSGHSNTVPAMVNQLTGSQLGNLQEWEYDFLYIITVGSDTSMQVLHYGQPSVSPN